MMRDYVLLDPLHPNDGITLSADERDCSNAEVIEDLISRADVLEGLKHSTAYLHDDIYTIVNRIPSAEATGALDEAITKYVADGYMLPPSTLNALPSAETTKKKAELKENGDWDCPDVYCDECDHHRSVEWCSLAIPKHEEIDETYKMVNEAFFEGFNVAEKQYRLLIETVEEIDKKSAEAEWIPCNKQMPDELEAVNVTWVNHNPPPYYKYTKDVPLVDTAVYYRGKWYWWDATVVDVLAEYGEDCNAEQIDKDIEILAWMPLPKPYREDGEA